jgi:hypothetical protein
VFAHVTLVLSMRDQGNKNGVLMLGSDSPIELTASGIQNVLQKPGVVADLSGAPDSPSGIDTSAQWQKYILDQVWISDARAAEFAAGSPLITDDNPYTEYDLLRHLLGPASPPATSEALLQAMPRQAP